MPVFRQLRTAIHQSITEIESHHDSHTMFKQNLNVINTRCYFSIVVYNKLLLWVSSGDQFISRNLNDAAIVSMQE